MTYATQAAWKATAGQREFDFPVPYLDADHVKVTVNGASVPFEWISPARLRLLTAPGAGAAVLIQRRTPLDQALVKFRSGAVLTEEELNAAVQQTLFIQQELNDQYADVIDRAKVRLGADLGIVTDAQGVVDELTQMVLADELLATLQQRINDIDLNASEILRVALDTSQRDTAIAYANDVKAALTSRADGLRGDLNALTGVVDGLIQFGDGQGIATVIQNEALQRVDGDTALASTLATLGAKSGDGLSFILNLNTVKASPTETLASRLAALSAADADNRARIVAEESARVTAAGAEARRIEGLISTSQGQAQGYTDAQVASERAARTTAISAEASRLDTLVAQRFADGKSYADAKVLAEETARVTAVAAEASARGLLAARVGTAEGAITSEQTARVNADGVLTSTLALLGAKNGAGTAFVLDLNKTLVSTSESLASRFSSLSSATANALSVAQTEITNRTTADTALGQRIDTMGARVGDVEAGLVTEQTARANAVSAEALARTQLAAAIRGELSAAIQNEASVRAGQDGVFANQFSLLGAKTSDGQAWNLNDNTVRLSNGQALATRLSGLDSRIGANEGAVINESQARAGADGALGQRVDGVIARVGPLEASVTTLSQAIDGVRARWGVSLNVNGHVSGVIANNSGTESSWTFVSSRFALVDPNYNNGQPFVPFEYSGGWVRIPNLMVSNLVANSIYSQHVNEGQINTPHIAEQALSAPVMASFNTVSRPYNYSSWLPVTVVCAAGQSVDLQVQMDVGYPSVRSGITFQLLRNGNWVPEAKTETGFDGNDRVPMSVTFTDLTPDVGNNTYSVLVYGSRLINGAVDCTLWNAVIRARVMKK